MPKTTQSLLDNYNTYANKAVDEQAILDKYNAATAATYAAQRDQDRATENQFYNQMYSTQRTAMDTIRQANAAAVSTGASRGVQAANELSALLGLQQEAVAGATEIAQARRQTAQEETAAMLDNTLKAYQQAQTERANLIQSAIQTDSIQQQRETSMQSLYLQALADGRTSFAASLENEMREMGIAIPNVTATTGDTNSATTTGSTTQPSNNESITTIKTPQGGTVAVMMPAGLQDMKVIYDNAPESEKQRIRNEYKNGRYNKDLIAQLGAELAKRYPQGRWSEQAIVNFLLNNYYN